MKAPTSWLGDYLSTKVDTKTMAEALEAGGIEVEQVLYAAKLDEQIIAAEIKKIAQHPNADKLNLATIFDGKHEIQVVCGAPNLKTGMKVALAPVGAKLPDGTVMKLATIRGESSPGMLATAQELGLSNDDSGVMPLPDNAKPGTPLRDIFTAEDVIDVTTQANRFDLLSLIGLAQEISAQTDTPMKMPPIAEPTDDGSALDIKIEAKEAVRRYMLVGIKLDQSHGTAKTAVDRLQAAGLRSINLAVDITNYTMWEMGQPLHAFDAAKVKFPITVRFAKAGETLETLDGIMRKLTPQDLIIVDQEGPIDLAGVMGGKRTEVTAETTEILLESASFDGTTVRKMAQRHGLRSDASARFERNLPVTLTELGLKRALYSYQMAVGAEQSTKLYDELLKPEVITKIVVDPTHISKILSIPVTAADLSKQLPKLGFEVQAQSDSVEVTVPWSRPDVVLAEDLAEEYIRLQGYDNVPSRLPKWQPDAVAADRYWPNLWKAKDALKALGLFEVITYSFVSAEQLQQFGYTLKDHLKLKNPLSSEQAYLRQNLLPSLMTAMVRNQGYRPEFGIYETSQVFIPTEPGMQPLEPKQLGVLIKSQAAYQGVKAALDRLNATFNADLRLDVTKHSEFLPSYSANIMNGKAVIGRIGQLHPKYLAGFKAKAGLGYLELDLEKLFEASKPYRYHPISRFPSLYRDLAVVVDRDKLWQDVEAAITSTELAGVSFLSDYYDDSLGKNKKSLAMRLEMFSLEGTLTDKEADKRLSKIVVLLEQRFGAKPRT